MRKKFVRPLGAALVTTAAALTLWLVVGGGGASAVVLPLTCELSDPQPAAPLELNSVAVTVGKYDRLKSVAMEKEVLDCQKGGVLVQVRDVETYVEIFTPPGGQLDLKPEIHVESTLCITNLVSGFVTCTTESVPLDPLAKVPGGVVPGPLAGCAPAAVQPADPVEMNTLARVPNLEVKTIKVDKAVYLCSGRVADLYLFTEIWEAPSGETFGRWARQDFGIVCFKVPSTGLPPSKCNSVAT